MPDPTIEIPPTSEPPVTPEGSFENDDEPVIIIKPRTGFSWDDVTEIWEYRELLYFLVWRDVKVRYKQTAIGVLWVLLQPMAMMSIFWVVFGRLAGIPSDGVPYPLFVLAGLIPWQLFARIITDSTNRLLSDQRLITKVYFPRILLPISAACSATLDFLVAFTLFLVLMPFFAVWPSWHLVFLPLGLLLVLINGLGFGLLLSGTNVKYRDVAHTTSLLLQLWFYLTPVVYGGALIPEKWKVLASVNPASGFVAIFRWIAFGAIQKPMIELFLPLFFAAIVFLFSVWWFRVREREFGELLGG